MLKQTYSDTRVIQYQFKYQRKLDTDATIIDFPKQEKNMLRQVKEAQNKKLIKNESNFEYIQDMQEQYHILSLKIFLVT